MINLLDRQIGTNGRFSIDIVFPNFIKIDAEVFGCTGFSAAANTGFSVFNGELTLTVILAILGFGIRIFVQECTFEENDNEVA